MISVFLRADSVVDSDDEDIEYTTISVSSGLGQTQSEDKTAMSTGPTMVQASTHDQDDFDFYG